ncbi:ROK family protein [Microlunatus elymi]|uniref:ROK family protein n=1 Tax=Microlunatus elymi TaxID=2596828 RepID=A0A516PTX0_9ACTN|nr:ROK family protein [Microlunatus elymi]QDP94645.1 ROK family protein [Microlunatus elymi]
MQRSTQVLDHAVLELARRRGAVTRPELALDLGVTAATITNVVKRLLGDQLLVESGHLASTGGKPRSLLRLNPTSRYSLGVSFGPGRLIVALTDFTGAAVGRAAFPMQAVGRAADLRRGLSDRLDDILKSFDVSHQSLAGIGVADPVGAGTPWLDGEDGALSVSEPAIEQVRRDTGLPVVVGDEASCAALAELWNGSPVEVGANFATLYMSTQITAGLVLNGRIHQVTPRGSLGHVSIDRNGAPCPCGARGCIDVLASPAAVVEHVLTNAPHARRLGLLGAPTTRAVDFAQIGRAAVQGDKTCSAAIHDSAEALAVGVANLVVMLDVQRVFLAGPGFADAGSIYEQVINDGLARVHRTGTRPVRVTLSRLDLGSAAIGAASLVLQSRALR